MFLVEWYLPGPVNAPLDQGLERIIACASSASAAGSPVQLIGVVTLPQDELAFALFDCASEGTVAQVCHQAGMPAQRLSVAEGTRFWRPNNRESPNSTPASFS